MLPESKVINFMGWRKTCATISIVLLLASIVSLATRGLEFGLDFTGGSQVELGFDRPADLSTIRSVLGEQGLENPVAILFGSDSEVLIRTQDALSDGVLEQLEEGLASLSDSATIADVRNAASDQTQFSEVLVFNGVSESALRSADLFDPRYYGRTQIATEGEAVTVAVENALDNVYSQFLIDALE